MDKQTIKKILHSGLGYEVNITESNSWEFKTHLEKKELQINTKDLDKNNNILYNIIYNTIAEGLYTEIPHHYAHNLHVRHRREHSLALSFFEGLRVQKQMIQNYPGVLDYFEYGFLADDLQIADSLITNLSKHIIFLYDIKKWYFGKILSHKLSKYIKIIISQPTTSLLIEKFNTYLLNDYIKLIENKSTKDSMEEEIEDLKEKSQEKQEELEKKKELSNLKIEEIEDEEKEEIKGFENELPKYNAIFQEILPLYKKLYRKLSPLIEENSYKKRKGGFKKGKVNLTQLYKAYTNEKTIFTNKIKSNKEYNFTLLIDLSGSMIGEKAKTAGKTCILLLEVFEKLGLQISIYGYNAQYFIFKHYSEKLTNKIRDNLMDIFIIPNGMHGAGNNDAFSINKTVSQMDFGDYLFVLSDGQPADTNTLLYPDDVKRTGKTTTNLFNIKQEIKNAIKKVNLLGIGIENNSVKDYYKNNLIIDNVQELPNKIIKILTKIIHKGVK